VPESKRLSDVIGRLRDEVAGSINIKSKQTRTNVQRALGSIISRLSQYDNIPPNGLIIFCGEIITRGDKTEFEYHCLTPPSPVKSFSYKCNSLFELKDAESLIELGDIYALLVLDLHEACWGILSGSDITVLGYMESVVPSKHSQGGQSSKRFERLRDIAINEYFVKLGDKVTASILPLVGNLKGVLIGGCGMTKDEFIKCDSLHHEIGKKIIDSFDTGYTDENGLYELVEASKEKLIGLQCTHEKNVFDEFLKLLAKDMGKCAYGIDVIFEKARIGQIKRIIAASNFNLNDILPISKQMNFEIEVISENSDSGKILNQGFGGMVAILRYSH
jgi:peptide chain release factor subunit 1